MAISSGVALAAVWWPQGIARACDAWQTMPAGVAGASQVACRFRRGSRPAAPTLPGGEDKLF